MGVDFFKRAPCRDRGVRPDLNPCRASVRLIVLDSRWKGASAICGLRMTPSGGHVRLRPFRTPRRPHSVVALRHATSSWRRDLAHSSPGEGLVAVLWPSQAVTAACAFPVPFAPAGAPALPCDPWPARKSCHHRRRQRHKCHRVSRGVLLVFPPLASWPQF